MTDKTNENQNKIEIVTSLLEISPDTNQAKSVTKPLVRIKDGRLVSFCFSFLIQKSFLFYLTWTLLFYFFSFSYLKFSKGKNKVISYITVTTVTVWSYSQSQFYITH